MILFHTTFSELAEVILQRGFFDKNDFYGTDSFHSGVLLSDIPLDQSEGVWGDAVLELCFSGSASALERYRWMAECKLYRQWLIPAKFVNSRMTVQVIPRETVPNWDT